MNDKSLLTLSEFKSVSGIDDSELVQMLAKTELPISIEEDGSLRIDISTIQPEHLATRSGGENAGSTTISPLIEEAVASELVLALDSILDEALSLALKWRSDETKDPLAKAHVAKGDNDD